jgi:chemotaxis protein methyltransferase CheR
MQLNSSWVLEMHREFNHTELKKAEVVILTIRTLSDYDFSNYSLSVLLRRLQTFCNQNDIDDISSLIVRMLNNDFDLLEQLAQQLTITHSKFFRDSEYFSRLFHTVVPALDAYPKIKVWSIACAGGEEVYSLATLFALKNMSNRISLLGTDINKSALERSKKGEFDIARLSELQNQFRTLQIGHASIVDFLNVNSDSFSFKSNITDRIRFELHNIVNGASFGEMHLVCCRNVLIYFSESEQKRIVDELLIPSVKPGGFLMLGDAENIEVFHSYPMLKKISTGINIYQKVGL